MAAGLCYTPPAAFEVGWELPCVSFVLLWRRSRPSAVRPVAALPASAKILIEIDKSAQRMTVSQDGEQLYVWPVSTGQRGYDTPGGEYTPFRMEKDHFSREWDDAPMPHSIFFTKKGHAIHGTEHLRNIGRPASHGCVRLEPQNARVLFDLVKAEGMANVRVVLFGPTGRAPAMVRRAPDARSAPGYVEPARRLTSRIGAGRRGASIARPRGYWVRRYDGPRVYRTSASRMSAARRRRSCAVRPTAGRLIRLRRAFTGVLR